MTRRKIRDTIQERLRKAGITDDQAETWILMEWKLGVSRTEYFMDPEKEVSEEQWNSLNEVLKKREDRIPLQYLMKSSAFMGYSFFVDEHVLIPRQDTECLVELAVEHIRASMKQSNGAEKEEQTVKVLDLCTGSGCIGISIQLLCPKTEVTLSDVSADALQVARKNAENLQAPVRFVQGDLFENITETYDYIVSNPPYIPSKVIEELMPEVRIWEPRLALDGAEDGLCFYRKIISESRKYLNPGGYLMFEIGEEQGEALMAMFREQGWEKIEVKKDLAGWNRIAMGRRPM